MGICDSGTKFMEGYAKEFDEAFHKAIPKEAINSAQTTGVRKAA